MLRGDIALRVYGEMLCGDIALRIYEELLRRYVTS